MGSVFCLYMVLNRVDMTLIYSTFVVRDNSDSYVFTNANGDCTLSGDGVYEDC